MDARNRLTVEEREHLDKMALKLVRGSVVEKVAARFVAQIIAEAASACQPDTDCVCVRREDLRELLLYMAHVKGQGSDTYTRLRSLLKEKGGENG